MSPNSDCRVRQRLKSSKNTTFCTRFLTFTTQLISSCAYCINLGYYASNGPNHIENGPNRVEFWLETVTFWLDRAPPRSGMSRCPLQKKRKKKSTKKWSFKKSLGTSEVGSGWTFLVSGRFFWFPPTITFLRINIYLSNSILSFWRVKFSVLNAWIRE